MTTTIPLKHWIKEALETSSAGYLVSQAYIESALRIAIALTQQISDAEDSSKSGLFPGIASELPPPFPVSCINWADCITVCLKPQEDTHDHDESLLPFPAAFSHLADDFGDLLEEVAQGVEERAAKLRESTAAALREGNGDGYLDVDCARISYGNNSAASRNEEDWAREKLQRIYSLGLVFYELFSGGELPPLEMLVVSSSNGGDLTAISSNKVEGEVRRSANRNGSRWNDFASTLEVSDDISLGENTDHYESWNGDYVASISNKRRSLSSRSMQALAASTGPIICEVSVGCLSGKGVPSRLCDLIYNMIDCINGDFMGNESYSEIVDVTCDLQLMLTKPSVYLHDLEVDKLSLTALDLNDTLFERKNECDSLRCSYRRFASGSSELAIITGTSGTGKSTMAIRLGNFITAEGGLFLSGKFDQMMHSAQPFSAIASAFNNYCDQLAMSEESERAMLVASKLQTTLGPDLYYLIQVIPNLSHLVFENPTSIPPNRDDCVDAQQRLQYLFCRFVEVISSCSGGPMTLFIDDVQWADSASISLIGQLLKTTRSMQEESRVFFLGACRDEELGSDHLFWKMIHTVRNFGFETTLVKLECMDRDTVTNVVSNLLHLSPRLVGSLSHILFHKTKGNPLFVSKMMLSLHREGLLRLSLARRRWEWDEEKIQSRKLPDDVAMFFVNSINTLATDVKIALRVLSCFGSSTACEFIQAIESDLNLNVTEPLQIAIAEGLVNKLDGKYVFCHDRIQEATYSMIEEQDRYLHHMNYGLSLINLPMRDDHVALLFTAVMQLNLGGPSAVQHADEYHKIAKYNLLAGKRAMEMSDFSSAFSFFDHGMTFLRKKHWQDQYDLSLELFNLAAKCALAIEDHSSLTMICDEVSRNARNYNDTLSSSFTFMSELVHSRISESVEFGFKELSRLGVDIPSSVSRENTLKLILETKSMLDEISDDTLLNYRVLSDYKEVMAIKFLAKLEGSINQVNPSLQPLVTIKIIQLTIEHGMSPMSAIGFAYFGGMIAELCDIRIGYRYTRLANALLDNHKCNEIAGEVMFVSSGILSYIEPLPVAKEYRIQGQEIAMAAGDIHWACMNRLGFTVALLWSGANLFGVKEALISAGHFSAEHDHRTSLYYIKAIDKTVSRLVEGEVLSDGQLGRSVIQNKNHYQLVVVYFQRLFVSLVFNNYDDMKCSAEKFFEFRMPSWHLLTAHATHAFIGGLASFRIYRETHDPIWTQRAAECKARIRTWKDQGSMWNFENKSFLLEAEECYSNGNIKEGMVSYEHAISSAQDHKFLHEEAFSYELAANFYFNIGNKSMALKYFTCAREAYFKWGAFAKVTTLYTYTHEKFGNEVVPLTMTNDLLGCRDLDS
eukprot:CCRYP_009601-RA/>CCRYP_009601-RA protein AED:0.04 eAED:0.04 QI:400/1/1/1/0.8/0.66/6/302/1357